MQEKNKKAGSLSKTFLPKKELIMKNPKK